MSQKSADSQKSMVTIPKIDPVGLSTEEIDDRLRLIQSEPVGAGTIV
jgi:hypothetical protein